MGLYSGWRVRGGGVCTEGLIFGFIFEKRIFRGGRVYGRRTNGILRYPFVKEKEISRIPDDCFFSVVS